MKIYPCDAVYRKSCRLCDKPINTSHIVLEFNSTLKLFFHQKCWEEFKETIKKLKNKRWCDRCEEFKPTTHSCFRGKDK